MDENYQTRLKKFVNHPLNLVVACRYIHDFLDKLTDDSLPSEEQIDRRLNHEPVTAESGK